MAPLGVTASVSDAAGVETDLARLLLEAPPPNTERGESGASGDTSSTGEPDLCSSSMPALGRFFFFRRAAALACC